MLQTCCLQTSDIVAMHNSYADPTQPFRLVMQLLLGYATAQKFRVLLSCRHGQCSIQHVDNG